MSISIIVPVYNVEPYLERCVRSILAQSHTDWELLLVDDGSPDHCPEICDSYAAKDKRITVISRENKGVGYSRNQGIKVSTGEFLAFMDPDDYYPNNKILHLMYSIAKSNNVKICGCSLIVYDENTNIKTKYFKMI